MPRLKFEGKTPGSDPKPARNIDLWSTQRAADIYRYVPQDAGECTLLDAG